MEPATVKVSITGTAVLTATASGIGKENFTYQWKHNGSDMIGRTEDTLEITNVTEYHGGKYECIVRNDYGDGNTSAADLVVTG